MAFPGKDQVLVGSQPPDIWSGRLGSPEWRPLSSVRDLPTRPQWTFVAPPYQAHILGFSIDPIDRHDVLAVVEQGGVLRSENGGETWSQCSPLWDAHVVVHAGLGVALVAEGEGIQRSTNGGETWSRCPEPDGYVTGLTRDPAGALFAAVREAGHAIWTSNDQGATWKPYVFGALEEPGHGVHALAADFQESATVYHGVGTRVELLHKNILRCAGSDLGVVRRVLPVRTRPAK